MEGRFVSLLLIQCEGNEEWAQWIEWKGMMERMKWNKCVNSCICLCLITMHWIERYARIQLWEDMKWKVKRSKI